jgi:hypothetical protein
MPMETSLVFIELCVSILQPREERRRCLLGIAVRLPISLVPLQLSKQQTQ